MQRRPWIIVGQSGRWRRPTPTCSSPSSTGWRRRRPRGRSTWWDEADPRNHPLSIGFEGCNRYDAHLLPLKLFIWCLSAIQTKTSSSSDTIITDHQDDDPCLVSTMTESLLPFLPGDPFTLIVTWIVEYWGDIVFLNSNWIFPRTKWHWCKAAVITTTGHPGPLSLAASCNLFKPWRWISEYVAGDQADVDLARGPVGRLTQPQCGAQLSSPPLRARHETLGYQQLRHETLGHQQLRHEAIGHQQVQFRLI